MFIKVYTILFKTIFKCLRLIVNSEFKQFYLYKRRESRKHAKKQFKELLFWYKPAKKKQFKELSFWLKHVKKQF